MTSPPTRLLVLDPGFETATGHHRALNAILQQHCARLGIECTVYGLAAKPDLMARSGATPLFAARLYRSQRSEIEVLQAAAESNASFLRDLETLGRPAPGSIVLMHTTGHLQLTGLAAWLRATPSPPEVRVVLRYGPDFRVSGPRAAGMAEKLYAQGIRSVAAACPGARFYSDTPTARQYYARLADVAVELLPGCVDFSPLDALPADSAPGERPSRFLFVGEGREEKGFHLLPEAIATALGRRPRLQFMVHVNLANPSVAERLGALGERVELTQGRVLGTGKYFAKLREADAVLLCYHARRYRMRATYVLLEALGAGRAAVVSGRGSSMQAELAELDPMPAVLVEEFSAAALADAMLRFDDRRLELRAAAARAAPIVRSKHGLARHFAMLFSGTALASA